MFVGRGEPGASAIMQHLFDADYLLKQLELRRTATLQWGPLQTQQLSEVRKGRFLLLGYAGNSAPDHVDQLHALPEYLKRLP